MRHSSSADPISRTPYSAGSSSSATAVHFTTSSKRRRHGPGVIRPSPNRFWRACADRGRREPVAPRRDGRGGGALPPDGSLRLRPGRSGDHCGQSRRPWSRSRAPGLRRALLASALRGRSVPSRHDPEPCPGLVALRRPRGLVPSGQCALARARGNAAGPRAGALAAASPAPWWRGSSSSFIRYTSRASRTSSRATSFWPPPQCWRRSSPPGVAGGSPRSSALSWRC